MITVQEAQRRLPRQKVYNIRGPEHIKHTRCGKVQAPPVCVTCGLTVVCVIYWKSHADVQKEGCMHHDPYGIRPDGSLVMFTTDHILPRSKGGTDRTSNLQIMCNPCNSRIKRNDISPEEWRQILAHPERHVTTGPRRSAFAKALLKERGLTIADLISSSQNIIGSELSPSSHWLTLYPLAAIEVSPNAKHTTSFYRSPGTCTGSSDSV